MVRNQFNMQEMTQTFGIRSDCHWLVFIGMHCDWQVIRAASGIFKYLIGEFVDLAPAELLFLVGAW